MRKGSIMMNDIEWSMPMFLKWNEYKTVAYDMFDSTHLLRITMWFVFCTFVLVLLLL